MFCYNCGSKLSESAVPCSTCGSPVNIKETQSSQVESLYSRTIGLPLCVRIWDSHMITNAVV